MALQSIVGPIIHCDDHGDLAIHKNVQIDIRNGKIDNVHFNPKPNNVHKSNVKRLENGQFLIPGLIDGHIHAVQLPNLGLGYDKSLLDWLSTYTYPLEKKYKDNKFCDRIFDAVVKRTLRMGTTTACYYASLHGKASLILAEKAAVYGQRALIGKVNMNNSPTNDYCESGDGSIHDTEKFIEEVENINNPLVQPIITPRFALSCSLELMKNLAEIARTKKLHVQTHISENIDEIQAVKDFYPQFSTYAEVYDAAGLLTNKTVLAHGIYLTDRELDIIHNRKSAVIHCPSSNTCLKSGLCDVRRLQAAKVKVGLGTDVSGGNLPSILDVMRAALQVSTHISFQKSNYNPLTYKDVFYLATLGGAEALDMHNKIGNFKPGKDFDALVIDLSTPNSALDNLQEYTLDEKLQRLIYSGDDRNIVEVYISGHRVV